MIVGGKLAGMLPPMWLLLRSLLQEIAQTYHNTSIEQISEAFKNMHKCKFPMRSSERNFGRAESIR